MLEERQGEAFRKRIKNIDILPGAVELLRNLTKIGVAWALATTGKSAQAKQLVGPLKIPSVVPLVTAEDVEKTKPAPDVFILAAQKLNVPLDQCIVIGDSPWDILAARRAKALGVGLLCGGYAEEELFRAGAHRVYESPEGLWDNIADLGISPD
jgi:HAD superfamily hydrolase (TIGR01509 family)